MCEICKRKLEPGEMVYAYNGGYIHAKCVQSLSMTAIIICVAEGVRKYKGGADNV